MDRYGCQAEFWRYEQSIKANSWETIGVNSPFELIMNSKYYTTKNIAHNSECSTLVLEAEKDDSF